MNGVKLGLPQPALKSDAMHLIRPNGLVERLCSGPRRCLEFEGYGRVQLGPATAETLRLRAQRHRRQRRRKRPDLLRGRMVDLTA